ILTAGRKPPALPTRSFTCNKPLGTDWDRPPQEHAGGPAGPRRQAELAAECGRPQMHQVQPMVVAALVGIKPTAIVLDQQLMELAAAAGRRCLFLIGWGDGDFDPPRVAVTYGIANRLFSDRSQQHRGI